MATMKKPSKNPFAGKESKAEEKKEMGKMPKGKMPMKGMPAFKAGGKVGKRGC